MTDQNSVSIDEVRVLVAERQRYDDWLSALDARKADTPAHVYERVRSDYSARRDDVLARLGNHVDGLAVLTSQLDGRLAELESSLSQLEDERMEGMLRNSVGEYDDQRWEEIRASVEERAASLNQEREGLLTEVEEARTLFASARIESDEVAEDSAEAAAAAFEEGSESAPGESDGVAEADAHVLRGSASGESPAVAGGFGHDGLEVNLVAEIPAQLAASDTDGITDSLDVVGDQDILTAEEVDDALAMFSDSASPDTPVRGIHERVDLSQGGAVPPASGAASGASAGRSPTPTGTAADAFDDLAFLSSVIGTDAAPAAGSASVSGSHTRQNAEQEKTLRCTECGTMNLPTEWYCERCGGELAAF